MLGLYTEFYSFPVLRFRPDAGILLGGAAASLLFAAIGAIQALVRVARLQPVEGMRPAAPRAFRRTLLERWRGAWRRLHPAGRMIFRNIARHRVRTAATVFGVGLAGSILTLSELMRDSIDELMDFQYRWMELQDVRVAFEEERPKSALFDIRRMEGVRSAEPELAVPVRFVHGPRDYRTAIAGIAPGSRLQGLYDREKRPVAPPRRGLLLSAKLAEILGASPGDLVETHLLKGTRKRLSLPVESVVDTYIGSGAWAEIGALSRWIGEEEVLTGALLLVDPAREAELGLALKRNPSVAAAVFQRQSIRNFRDTIARSQGIMRNVIRVLAGVLAFGVIYNASRIALAERERELASLRVIGFTRREVTAVVFGENLLLAVLSLPIGLALGGLFGWVLTRIYETDLFRIPMVFPPLSGFRAAVTVLLFALLAQLAVRRRIEGLDFVEILKTHE
jgi:putative ABC transport system permease protein